MDNNPVNIIASGSTNIFTIWQKDKLYLCGELNCKNRNEKIRTLSKDLFLWNCYDIVTDHQEIVRCEIPSHHVSNLHIRRFYSLSNFLENISTLSVTNKPDLIFQYITEFKRPFELILEDFCLDKTTSPLYNDLTESSLKQQQILEDLKKIFDRRKHYHLGVYISRVISQLYAGTKEGYLIRRIVTRMSSRRFDLPSKNKILEIIHSYFPERMTENIKSGVIRDLQIKELKKS